MCSGDKAISALVFFFLAISRYLRSELQCLVGSVLLAVAPVTLFAAQPIGEIVVTGTLSERLGSTGSVSRIDGDVLAEIRHNHIHEALSRVPSVWVTRGSGQEHLSAIRSAVFTGPGACGKFLYLEDGLPIRPAGFCNVNNLFEVNGEQAGSIESLAWTLKCRAGGQCIARGDQCAHGQS